MRRMLILLQKDIKSYWILPVIILSLAFFVAYLPSALEANKTLTLGMIGSTSLPNFFPFETITFLSKDEGMEAVQRGEIAALYLEEEGKLVCNSRQMQPETAQLVARLLVPSPKFIEEREVNSIDPQYLTLPLFCSIALVMLGLTVAPIVFQNEKNDRTLEALMLTPLTYRELVLGKATFSFTGTFCSSMIFLWVMDGFIGNIPGIITIIALGSFLLALTTLALGLPFDSTEMTMALVAPLMMVISFGYIITSSFKNYSLPLPIIRGLYRAMIWDQFPTSEVLVLGVGIILLIIIDSFLMRKVTQK